MRLCILVNQEGGSFDSIRHVLNDTVSSLRRKYDVSEESLRLVVCEGSSIPGETEKALADGFDRIAVSGGDGTLNSVASLLLENNSDTSLAVLPGGTFNHFAKDLGISLDFKEALETAFSGATTCIDAAFANDTLFLNNASIGFYPRAVLERERLLRKKKFNKRIAMMFAAVKTMFVFPRKQLHVEFGNHKGRYHTPMLFVGNNEYQFTPYEIGNRTSLKNGELFVVLSLCSTFWCMIRFVFELLFFRKRLDTRFLLKKLDAVKVNTRRKKLVIAVDGELKRLKPPIQFRIRPASLNVVVPENNRHA